MRERRVITNGLATLAVGRPRGACGRFSKRISRLAVLLVLWSFAGLTAAGVPDHPSASAQSAAEWSVPAAFQAGLTALEDRQTDAVDQAIQELPKGPLASYLRFRELYDALASAKMAAPEDLDRANTFLETHPKFVFRKRLMARYLRGLAAQEQWSTFLTEVDRSPSLAKGTTVRCLALQGHIQNQSMTSARVREAESIWARGWSQPDACDPVFSWLDKHGHLTARLYRKRIRSAVERGQSSLAHYLARRGPKGMTAYLDRWMQTRTDPEQAIRAALKHHPRHLPGADDRVRLQQAMVWLLRRQPETAHALLNRIPSGWKWTAAKRRNLARRIALKAGYLHLPQAHDWLMALPKSVRDEEVLTWTVRSALRELDWAGVKKAIVRMPKSMAQEHEWQYWLARADAQLGQPLAAEKRYRALVRTHGYYGLLAADQLGIDYDWPQSATRSSTDDSARATAIRQLRQRPNLRLAFVLHAAGEYADARSAFMAALDEVPQAQLTALAQLTEQANWHDRLAVVIARMPDDIRKDWFAARYPMPWRTTFDTAAAQQEISPDWLFAVVRRESLFMADVGSHAGAQGLMQLMPRTARWINRKADLHLPSLDLHDPDTSIRLGAAYLRYLADRFPQQRPVAIAAYNAGPGRVRQWLPRQPLPADVWVDTIVYDETRAYTRAVLAGSVIYAWRLSHASRPAPAQKLAHTLRLRDLMPTIMDTTMDADSATASR